MNGFLHLRDRQVELHEYLEKVEKLAQEKTRMEKEVGQLKTDKAYLERVIRKETGMIKKNEFKYMISNQDDDKGKKNNENIVKNLPSDDVIDEKMADVEELIEKKKIKEARVKLDEIKELTGFEISFDYLDYPSSIIRGIKALDALINDAEGYFDDYPRMDGVMTTSETGPSSGYFVVKGTDGEKSFIWEADLIISEEFTIEENPKQQDPGKYRDPWIGRKVTVYYDDFVYMGSDTNKAVKIIVHGSSPN